MTVRLLSLAEAAERMGVPENTLRYWRHLGKGPQGARIGRRVVFRESDIDAFVAQAFADEVTR